MGWIIALGILVVIALLPVGITAQYSGDDPDIRLIIGPFRRKSKPSGINYLELIDTLYAEEPMPGTQNGDPPSVLKRFLSQMRSLLMLLSEARRVVRVKRLDLKIVLGGDDPCDLALIYGTASAALWNLLAALERLFVIKKRDVQLLCDFDATQTTIDARVDITLPVYRLISFLWRYVMRLVKLEMRNQNMQKGGAVK
jgi:hypothetical protein